MDNQPYFLALNRMSGAGIRTLTQLLARWPNLKHCFDLSYTQLCHANIAPTLAKNISQFNWQSIENDLQFDKHPNQFILTLTDPRYPRLLKEINSPPIVLYALGDLTCLQQPMLAMVGSRSPSPHGIKNAYQWAKQLTETPLTIVSGMARGIDTAAHKGCLDSAMGKTIAVLGTGIDRVYPASNRDLAACIRQKGLLLSEFPLQTTANAGHFPRRNRIISGLSLATLVVEATLKSGSLITARCALEQNRDVLALPGSIHLPQAEGCHHLLKQGAALVTCYQDVLEAMGLSKETVQPAAQPLRSDPDPVLNCIGFEPTSIDTIQLRSGVHIAQLMSHLSQLELDGLISGSMGGYIRRTHER